MTPHEDVLPGAARAGVAARLVHGLGVAVIVASLAWPLAATAQSAARGQSLYTQLGCGASNCHGSNAALNQQRVLNGAGSATAVEYSVAARTDKQYLLNVFASDADAARDLAAWLATVNPAPPPPPTLTVVEYLHGAFGHYFVTSIAAEIAALDTGQFGGWARTSRTFKVYATGGTAQLPVCRFFTVSYAPKSSHFYTPFAAECDQLKQSSVWQHEGQVFHVDAPDAAGGCPAGTQPVYRLYNAGQGGAPNHRYTTESDVRTEMLGRGWVSEGHGPLGVIFCAPT